MKAKEAIALLRELRSQTTATGAVHDKIIQAIDILEAIALPTIEHEG